MRNLNVYWRLVAVMLLTVFTVIGPAVATVNALDVRLLDENIIRVKYNVNDWTDAYDITGQLCYQGEPMCFLEFDIVKKTGQYTDSTVNVGADHTREIYTRIVYHTDPENPAYINTSPVDKDKLDKKNKSETGLMAQAWHWGAYISQNLTDAIFRIGDKL